MLIGLFCAVDVLRHGQLVSTVTFQDVTGDCFKPAALATLILGFAMHARGVVYIARELVDR